MNKLTGALLIFTIFPAHFSANSCDIEGYTIGFFKVHRGFPGKAAFIFKKK
ncbi:hypothetical protein [Vibrio parahaemolyticus]|uniref:hypothetical protein n=1 Tax=Vibrio parahaemolyticus TaxID=670 RepID=UPI0015DDADA9|nr:hypothetical protein [Vibrio parahaemolyticus]